MLKIAIDATPWTLKPSGVGLYVANLIQALDELRLSQGGTAKQPQEDFELDIVFQPGLKNWLRGNLSLPDYLKPYSSHEIFPLPVRLSNFFIKFPQLFSPQVEQSFGAPHLFHGTNYTVFPFKKTRKVMTIYDLTFLKYRQYANSTVKAYAKRVQKCLQWTDLVLTISQSSKQDIVDYLGVDAERVCVTPLASRYHLDTAANLSDSLKESTDFDFSKPYILFVSTIEPRKNLATLISAFDYLKQKYRMDHQLVLIGQKGWLYESIFERIARSPYRDSIHHLNYLSDDLVAFFYSKAEIFVYPSHYEGFGLPVLEAMTLGAPVVTTNVSSLPEVAGDAALLVEPNQVTDLAEAMLQILNDAQLRNELIQKGKEQAKLYSWRNTAKETLKAYKLLESKF